MVRSLAWRPTWKSDDPLRSAHGRHHHGFSKGKSTGNVTGDEVVQFCVHDGSTLEIRTGMVSQRQTGKEVENHAWTKLKCDQEFAIRLRYARPMTVREAAEDLGVAVGMLYRCRKRYTA